MFKNTIKSLLPLTFTAAFLFSSFAVASEVLNERTIQNLNGKVKKYTIKAYTPIKKSNDWEAGELTNTFSWKFDEVGNLIKYENDYMDRTTKIENGRVVEEYMTNWEDPTKTKVFYKLTIKINWINDSTVERTGFTEDGEDETKVILYFDNKKLIKTKLTSKDGNLNLVNTYKYDNKGLIIEEVYEDIRDNIQHNIFLKNIETDSHGNWTKQLHYEKNPLEPKELRLAEIDYYPN